MKGKADGRQVQALQMGGRCLERSFPRDQQSAGLLMNLWSGVAIHRRLRVGSGLQREGVGGNMPLQLYSRQPVAWQPLASR